MAHENLTTRRFLIVEDEYFLADEAQRALADAGAEVLGPVATLDEAWGVLGSDAVVDGVLLDVNLRGAMAFDMADALRARGVPFAFITGYDCATLPEQFADVPRLQKPASSAALVGIAAGLARVAGMN
jgi:CheY-like chemotaxis protein